MKKCAVRDCLCQLSLTFQYPVPVKEPMVRNWTRFYAEMFGEKTSVAMCNGSLRVVNLNSIFNVIPPCSHHFNLMDTCPLLYTVEVEENKYITLVDDYRNKAVPAIRKIREQTFIPSLLEMMVAVQLHVDDLTGAGEVWRRAVYPLPGANHTQSRHVLMYLYERVNRAPSAHPRCPCGKSLKQQKVRTCGAETCSNSAHYCLGGRKGKGCALVDYPMCHTQLSKMDNPFHLPSDDNE